MTWREFVKSALMKAGLSEREASEWAAFFIEVRKGLHGDVFYGRWYEEKEHKPLMEKSKDYLELVVSLLSRSGTSEVQRAKPLLTVFPSEDGNEDEM